LNRASPVEKGEEASKVRIIMPERTKRSNNSDEKEERATPTTCEGVNSIQLAKGEEGGEKEGISKGRGKNFPQSRPKIREKQRLSVPGYFDSYGKDEGRRQEKEGTILLGGKGKKKEKKFIPPNGIGIW